MTAANAAQISTDAAHHASLRSLLDLLLQHAITPEAFEASVTRLCLTDGEEIWALLALLDQYHRRGLLPTPLFRTLKESADRRGLGRNVTSVPPSAQATARSQDTAPPSPTVSPPAPAPAPVVIPPALELPVLKPLAAANDALAATGPIALTGPNPELPVGSVLRGRYRVEERLGGGATSTVYRVRDRLRSTAPADQQCVALKVFHAPSAGGDPLDALRPMFQSQEALSHPNIVNVHELDREGAIAFVTMELLIGETLETVLERRLSRPLPRDHAWALIREVGAALIHAHQRGVAHGALQPHHIMITGNGEVRIIDFASGRGPHDTSALNVDAYASCEVLEGHSADRRDDVFSMACLAYQLLAGRHPFKGMNAAQARGRNLLASRPVLLRRGQWQALRAGLAWRRENRSVGMAWWLARMSPKLAAPRLPAPHVLVALPTPRRHIGRPLLVASALVAAVATAATLNYLPASTKIASSWDALRASVGHSTNRLGRLVEWLSPASNAGAKAATALTPAPATLPPESSATRAASRHRLHLSAAPALGVAAAAAPPATAPPTTESAPAEADRTAPSATQLAPPATPARIELSADSYTVLPGESAARIQVRRRGSLHGDVSFVWSTESASARENRDFVGWIHRAEQIPAGTSSVTLLVPIINDATRQDSRVFYVNISEAGGGAELGATARASILMTGGP